MVFGGGRRLCSSRMHPQRDPADSRGDRSVEVQVSRRRVIDDCEDNNNQVMSNAGRSGYWYTFADKSTNIQPAAGGTFTMSAGGANGSPTPPT